MTAGKVLMEKMKEMGCEGGDVLMITISQARLNRPEPYQRDHAGRSRKRAARSSSSCRARTTPGAEAQTQASDMLSANPQACGFFTQHDEAALGAYAALEESGRADNSRLRLFRRQSGNRRVDQTRQTRRGLDAAAGADGSYISMEVGLKYLRGEEVEKETWCRPFWSLPIMSRSIESQLRTPSSRSRARRRRQPPNSQGTAPFSLNREGGIDCFSSYSALPNRSSGPYWRLDVG